jgi:ferredoxin
MGYKIKIDRDLCIGTGNCIDTAARTFELDDDNICIIKDAIGDSDEDILEAAKVCPVTAILIFDEETEKAIYPKESG